ncbi:hypothetical protein G6321_00035850 [Bradyrhizobium barranii subsp. barranii]|uniref:Uncharacterized protein n=1 Tax=Bradyrhizobium barranii subsp. barranii TaxID=2823807 RepID=A0A7Z0QHR3_9BRAD|nr:hypothetical protein [Bradyrhizobium barranii]UGX91146.1 hypothetical protein G6321_00035850 [Bradyrhizobium barranii subsp. barranii]
MGTAFAGHLAAIVALRPGLAPPLSSAPFDVLATRAVVIVYLIHLRAYSSVALGMA